MTATHHAFAIATLAILISGTAYAAPMAAPTPAPAPVVGTGQKFVPPTAEQIQTIHDCVNKKTDATKTPTPAEQKTMIDSCIKAAGVTPPSQ